MATGDKGKDDSDTSTTTTLTKKNPIGNPLHTNAKKNGETGHVNGDESSFRLDHQSESPSKTPFPYSSTDGEVPSLLSYLKSANETLATTLSSNITALIDA